MTSKETKSNLYLDGYLKKATSGNERLGVALKKSALDFAEKHLDTFDFNSHKSGLLFGHVQSGKTGQMLAIAAAAADRDFKFFILLTTDNVILHKQTLERAKSSLGGFLSGFNVFGETDEEPFLTRKLSTPTLLILKKNAAVLTTWLNNISTNALYKDEPLFVLDDEADASSLNTKVNTQEQSRINHLLERINKFAPSSLYLHVTATPQSLVLQVAISGWKPEFSFYLPPGPNYLGGDFFYGEQSQCLFETDDNERDELLAGEYIPQGLRKSILHFLVAGSALSVVNPKAVCSMLVHPGARTAEHATVKTKIEKFLEGVKTDLIAGSSVLEFDLHDAWKNLSTTKEGIPAFESIFEYLRNEMPGINITVLNSKTPLGSAYDKGLNIVIGGNTLGRGVTFPGLHIVYYCRNAKHPQADTSWQHARIFGYDRDPDLCRIFSPRPLIKLFRELNDANSALFSILREKGPQEVNLMTPKGSKPTRTNVILKESLVVVAGGVNYFPLCPAPKNTTVLDRIVGVTDFDSDISLEQVEEILRKVHVENTDEWNPLTYADCVSTLMRGGGKGARLIVRVNRSISKNTGTLLSPTDRDLAAHYKDRLVLVMYRIEGEVAKGWDGEPMWVPNIKFPNNVYFYFQRQ